MTVQVQVNFSLYPVLRNLCLPISRKELLLEIVEKRSYGAVTHIWHHPGHIFITTDEGRKLFTFDCKPVDQEHAFDTGCLDIASIPSSVVDVCLASESVALVVTGSGQINCWKFTRKFFWSHLSNIELCLSPDSSISSITFMKTSGKIVWCEHQRNSSSDLSDDGSSVGSYSIWSKQFSTDLHDISDLPSCQLIRNCPPCTVTAMTADLLFIQTQHTDNQVTVTLIYASDKQEMTMFLGEEKFFVPKAIMADGIDFSSLLVSHISSLLECKTVAGDLGLRQCVYENKVASLDADGFAEVYSIVKVMGNEQPAKRSFQLENASPPFEIRHWFLCSRHIGVVHHKSLWLYSLEDGKLQHRWESEDLDNISFAVSSSSPSFLTWILKDKELYSLQRNEAKTDLPYSSPENLPQNNLLQTDILRLAYLHQLKLEGYNKDVVMQLQELLHVWKDGQLSHQVQIVEKIEPLVNEYVRLDKMSKYFKDSKKTELKSPDVDHVKNLVDQEMATCQTASKVERNSKLLWLSNIYPHQLLTYLIKGITIDAEKIIPNEMPQWQALLDLDGQDLSKFETVCRLLFVLYPQKLVHFVQCAESVYEHKIGVTPFMRKRHILKFYKKACDCLPPGETSSNIAAAGVAYATLVLACKEPNGEERALKYLLAHDLWTEAMDFLKTACKDNENLPCFLFIVVSALASKEMLYKFLPEIFEIMPTWKSFLTFAQIATARPEIREQQLSFSTSNVFHQSDMGTDTCLADIKSSFLRLVTDMKLNTENDDNQAPE